MVRPVKEIGRPLRKALPLPAIVADQDVSLQHHEVPVVVRDRRKVALRRLHCGRAHPPAEVPVPVHGALRPDGELRSLSPAPLRRPVILLFQNPIPSHFPSPFCLMNVLLSIGIGLPIPRGLCLAVSAPVVQGKLHYHWRPVGTRPVGNLSNRN